MVEITYFEAGVTRIFSCNPLTATVLETQIKESFSKPIGGTIEVDNFSGFSEQISLRHLFGRTMTRKPTFIQCEL